jgi:hypothetical protein
MFASLPSAVRSYLRLDAPPDVSALLDARDVARILNAFASPAEVFSLLTVMDVRRALVRAPARVHLLVRLLVAHLESLRDDAAFCPRPRQAESGRLPALGGAWGLGLQSSTFRQDAAGGGASVRDRHREALNCIRILTRILPVIMEGDHDATCIAQSEADAERPDPDSPPAALASTDFERSLFLSRLPAPATADLVLEPRGTREPLPVPEASQFVIDEDETEDGGGPASPGHAPSLPLTASGEGSEPPLIERLVTLVVDLLFYSGFTLPWTAELLALPDSVPVRESRVHYAIWEQGVGSSIELKGTSRTHEANRVETLRLLLVLFSKAIYVPATEQSTHKDAALSFAATLLDRSVALPLLCSLLNTGVKHAGDSHWLASLAGLPGGLVKDRLAGTPTPEETRSTLAGLCLQTLGVLLAWEPTPEDAEAGRPAADPQRPPLASNTSSASLQSNARGEQNVFRFYLSKLHRQADFVLLSTALLDAAAVRGSGSLNPLAHRAAPTLITGGGGPGGGSLAHAPEALLLLWRLLTHNARFRVFMLDDEVRTPLFLSCLLSHALTHKDSVAQQGLVRLCIFMLQDASATSSFALRICARGSAANCRIPNASRLGIVSGTAGQAGTAADALIQAAYAVMASTRGALSALYPPLVIALANTAPSWRGLTVASSARLASLLGSFSAPAFLLADEGNPRLLYFLLEALNAVLHRNAQANPNLMYALLRSRRDVERLSRFTLASGIADVRRSRQRTGNASQAAQPPQRASRTNDTASSAQTSPTMLDTSLAKDEKAQSTAQGEQERVSNGAGDAVPESSARADIDASSEKVRGKRRQMSGTNGQSAPGVPTADALDAEDALVAGFSDDELLAAASTIGRNGFIATPAWVASWQSGCVAVAHELRPAPLIRLLLDYHWTRCKWC